MRGRKPKPTALKVLQGNPGKRPVNRNEPKPTPTAPLCPTWLSAEGKAEWRRVVPELDRIGMLTKVDRAALATYCEAWATFMSAQRLVHEHGLVLLKYKDLETLDGTKIYVTVAKNPAAQMARDAAGLIRQFSAEFGLTPSARTRIDLPEPDEGTDPMANIFS
ncbi:phage terminase small subunit P27 family [Acidiferrimicrobium sp. IK]|uniref:phage terminase small subunit P27 family n=1 Tax=Acidiferrimicrobium sp. IK TaxID=2871700 RepID=UPI0021CB91F5|nr:phage terminase small subunit P27 family [Acidiferrimicrobium sp. IK]MCU4184013.1 phage terminase small subunit P27 family [Acidiferrimicrobium sp. IK]